MKRLVYLVFPLFVAGIFIAGCDSFKSDDSGDLTITGFVIDQDDRPVANATVEVRSLDEFTTTDETGAYAMTVELDSTSSLTLTGSKAGYSTATSNFVGRAGETVDLTLRLILQGDSPVESGQASNILLSGQSASTIGVTESGSEEVAQLTFQVTDSTGTPITLKNSTTINFAIGQGPGGGEFLFPESVETDNSGLATVNISAGTTAGVVQIVASTTVGGQTIRSLPVAMTIHGGLPDGDHFTLGPEKFNFPGLLRFGTQNGISVLLGDKWFNPVRPGTAVYFTSSHGVIEGSTLTDGNGQGSVNLLSGNPIPPDGVSIISASTADENQDEIISQTPVLWSGAPRITLTQTGTSNDPYFRTYDYTVTDGNGNPLSEGTGIAVSASGTKIITSGNVNTLLSDTVFLNGGMTYDDVLRGPGITEFSFAVVEDPDGEEGENPALQQVTIAVSGPNGNLEITYGASGVSTSTEGAVVQQLDSKTFVVEASY